MSVLLEGNISKLSLFNLLQLVKLEQKTCKMTIAIKELQQEALLFFQLGLIKHAKLNKLSGVDAIHRLICWWTTGEFKIEEIAEIDIPEESVTVSLENILIESARRTDELSDLKKIMNSLENKMSFSQEAIYEIQNLNNQERPDWIPAFMTEIPVSFSLARYFDVCPHEDLEACNTLKYLLSSGVIVPHEMDSSLQANSAIDSLMTIIMEYLGFSQSQEIFIDACESLQIPPESNPGFNQLLILSDYIKERIKNLLGEEISQEVEWRLRARITSLC